MARGVRFDFLQDVFLCRTWFWTSALDQKLELGVARRDAGHCSVSLLLSRVAFSLVCRTSGLDQKLVAFLTV